MSLPPRTLQRLADRLRLEASAAGITRLSCSAGPDRGTTAARGHLERARAELRAYLAGARTGFSVAVDLDALAPFQARVLEAVREIAFGGVESYAALARRIGHPGAARAVGNALAANPVPILVPCHRVLRSDGTWGPYALGAPLKTALLTLERAVSLRRVSSPGVSEPALPRRTRGLPKEPGADGAS